MVKFLEANYWNNRYLNQETNWDLGAISPPIKAYINQIKNKDLAILIPGAGNAHEAVYLLQNGFKNVTVIDFASAPLAQLKVKLADVNPSNYQLIQDDFFNHKGQYELIIEQTFFCAISPTLRLSYVNHSHQLLKENGKLVGLLFNKMFPFDGPPFGGNKEEYLALFGEKFRIQMMEEAYNSVPQRQGVELFIMMKKK